MISVRAADHRGLAETDWLTSRHTFSFGHYLDRNHMGFGPLRVINEDQVQPARGFDTHGHKDMEIISYVLSGALEHKDSLGTGSVIRPGDVQRMTAGTGVRHSEYNGSDSELVHFLQIWILPERNQLQPGYEQKAFSAEQKRGRLRLVGSRDGRDGSVTIHQDVNLYAGLFDEQETASLTVAPDRKVWIQVAQGTVEANGQALASGDGMAMSQIDSVELSKGRQAEVLVFDMTA